MTAGAKPPPKPAPDTSRMTFDYWGVTGMGRHRTVNSDGKVVQPPAPWYKPSSLAIAVTNGLVFAFLIVVLMAAAVLMMGTVVNIHP